MTELFAWEVIRDLPVAGHEGGNIYAHSSLAWADTLAARSL